MTAFRQVMSKLQDGQRDEALIGLDFVLRLDPAFAPGLEIQKQLASGEKELDLSGLLSHIDAPSTDEINMLLIEAVEDFNQHNYVEAQKKVSQVLLELPGHNEARSLQQQIASAMKVETQVGHFLAQAREALDGGDAQEAVNFVVMAQALDPHHKGIQTMLAAIDKERGAQIPSTPAELTAEPAPDEQQPPAPNETPAPSVAAPSPPAEAESGFDSDFDFNVEDDFDVASDEDGPSPNETIAIDQWDVAGGFEEPPGEDLFQAPEPEHLQPEAVPETQLGGAALGEGHESFSSGDVADLFASDSSEAAGVAPEPELPPPPAMGFENLPGPPSLEEPLQGEVSGPAFDESSGSDISDLFESPGAPPDESHAAPEGVDGPPHEDPVRPLLEAAQKARESGFPEEARTLVEEILGSVPNHVEAIDLMAQIEAELQGSAPEPPELDGADEVGDPLVPPPPSLVDDDLFDSDFEEDDFAEEAEQTQPEAQETVEATPAHAAKKGLSINLPGLDRLEGLPWRFIGMGAAGVVLVLAATLVGLRLFSDEDEIARDTRAITEVLNQADELFETGRQAQAIELLSRYEADGLEQQRINKRLERYKKEMSPPTPTPVPENLVQAKDLLGEGRWFAAYELVVAGLEKQKDDSELDFLKKTILQIEPALESLFTMIRDKEFAEAAILAGDLAERHPAQVEIVEVQNRCLYNAALASLRSYNLAEARSHLLKLQSRQPDDEEVQRILRFVTSYTNRPVDMQLEIFVSSLQNR